MINSNFNQSFIPNLLSAELFDNQRNRTCWDSPASSASNLLPVNISENDKQVSLLINVPGLKREQINIAIEAKTLSVKIAALKNSEESVVETKLRRQEIKRLYEASRIFKLSDTLDIESINANLVDGQLNITIDKINQQDSVRKININ